MSDMQKVVDFVDHMVCDCVVKRIKHEYPAPQRYTYYCEDCDSQGETEEGIEHSEYCVITQWRALKQEIGYANTEG